MCSSEPQSITASKRCSSSGPIGLVHVDDHVGALIVRGVKNHQLADTQVVPQEVVREVAKLSKPADRQFPGLGGTQVELLSTNRHHAVETRPMVPRAD